MTTQESQTHDPRTLPFGTAHDAQVKPFTAPIVWAFEGKQYTASLRPLSWTEEARLISVGAYWSDFAEYCFANLVKESSIPMQTPSDRLGWSPAFGRTACRELGFNDLYKDLGLSTLMGEAARKNE